MNPREWILIFYGTEPQGCTEDEIAAIRSIFGALPKTVEDFWRTAGQTKQLNCGQDNWIFPEAYKKWSWPGESEDLILLMENQGCCRALVRREDLSSPDPPVYVQTEPDEKQVLSAPAVSEFLEAALLYEAVWQLDFTAEEFYWLSDQEIEIIQAKMSKYPAVLKNWFEMDVTFFHNRPDNLVVVMDVGGQYQCLSGAATEESFLAMMEVMKDLGEPL